MVIGTGTHQLKGIEIYRGCPIFYSLGNFVFRDELINFAPHDLFERYHADSSITPEELYILRSRNATVGLEFDPYNYRSVVPVIETDGRRISSVELVPIELGFDDPSKEKGMPYLADNETSEEIYSRLSALSREYGTHLDFDGRRIHIQL